MEKPFEILVGTCQTGERPSQVEGTQLPQILRQASGTTWAHMIAHDYRATETYLVEELLLPPIDVENTLTHDERALIAEHADMLFVSVPMVDCIDDDESFEELGIFLFRHTILTVVRTHHIELENKFKSWLHRELEEGETATGILYEVLDVVVDHYFPIMDSIQDAIAELEENIFDSDDQESIREALRLKRRLLRIRRRVAPMRDVFNALLRRDHPLIPRSLYPYFHDVYDHAIRLMEASDLHRDILASVIDAHLTVVSNRLNEVMRFMTAISTVLMSVGVISGIYGMNFQHMPELRQPWGYGAALAAMGLVATIELMLFRRKGWL